MASHLVPLASNDLLCPARVERAEPFNAEAKRATRPLHLNAHSIWSRAMVATSTTSQTWPVCFFQKAAGDNVELTGRGNNHITRPVVDEKPAYSSSGSTICYPPPEWNAPTIQPPDSARPGKHLTTTGGSRRARG